MPESHVRRILLAEDDDEIRQVARRVLTHAGFLVTATRDGAEALASLHGVDGKFDAVLSDILMPGMDGIELAVRARAEYPRLPFVFMTGVADIPRDRDRASGLCEAILSKPFDIDELVGALKSAVAANA